MNGFFWFPFNAFGNDGLTLDVLHLSYMTNPFGVPSKFSQLVHEFLKVSLRTFGKE